MANERGPEKLTIDVPAETMERIAFLAGREGISPTEMAARLLEQEAEAQAGLTPGPWLRKYMHR
jgi:hypothetical protein